MTEECREQRAGAYVGRAPSGGRRLLWQHLCPPYTLHDRHVPAEYSIPHVPGILGGAPAAAMRRAAVVRDPGAFRRTRRCECTEICMRPMRRGHGHQAMGGQVCASSALALIRACFLLQHAWAKCVDGSHPRHLRAARRLGRRRRAGVSCIVTLLPLVLKTMGRWRLFCPQAALGPPGAKGRPSSKPCILFLAPCALGSWCGAHINCQICRGTRGSQHAAGLLPALHRPREVQGGT